MELKRLFEHATTFGSLIQVPKTLAAKLPALKQLSEVPSQDLFVSEALKHLRSLVQQAGLLAARYDAVVTNPPYMGGKGMNTVVKQFARHHFPDAKSDLFACFIERGYTLAKDAGHSAIVTMQSWMFLSSFQKMRERILREKTIGTMAHLGARAFGSISGEVVQTTAFVLRNSLVGNYKPAFFRLLDGATRRSEQHLPVARSASMRPPKTSSRKSREALWPIGSVNRCALRLLRFHVWILLPAHARVWSLLITLGLFVAGTRCPHQTRGTASAEILQWTPRTSGSRTRRAALFGDGQATTNTL